MSNGEGAVRTRCENVAGAIHSSSPVARDTTSDNSLVTRCRGIFNHGFLGQ